jgi:Holliday junction resolvasome RuvABC ATP-dependent DNA helicase subunit
MIFLTIFIICFIYYFAKALKADGQKHVQIKINALTDKDEKIPIENNPVIDINIKDKEVDTSRIIAYTGETIKKFEFRPQTWEQFIAQEEAKRQAQTIVKKVRRGIRGHFILGGLKGCGKTTFVELFAKSLGAKLFEYVGRQINEDNIPDIINAINQSKEQYVVLFIDEIDTCEWRVLKIFNPIIEQFKINEKAIKPFVFASATISRHLLVKNNPDLLDRISHSINFVRYTLEDLATILNQYKNQLYPADNVSNDMINIISSSCKFTPRIAISLLEDYIVEQNMKKVLSNRNIIIEGLDIFDIKVLEKLATSKRAIGSNSLALQVGVGEQTYLREIEPFLLEFGYIQRVPSRIITDKGQDILRQIKEKIDG